MSVGIKYETNFFTQNSLLQIFQVQKCSLHREQFQHTHTTKPWQTKECSAKIVIKKKS